MQFKKVLVDSNGNIVNRVKPSPLPPDVAPKSPTVKIYTPDQLLTPTKRISRKELGPNGHWDFPEQMGRAFGFIYVIRDTIEDKLYLGKKQFEGTGKVNKGQETNWKSYTSSCTALVHSIRKYGKEHFKFYVLEQYQRRGTLGWAETWSLCFVEAPLNRNKWHNGLINKVSWNVSEPISERHKERLNAIIKGSL
jgi:hypothetical protein